MTVVEQAMFVFFSSCISFALDRMFAVDDDEVKVNYFKVLFLIIVLFSLTNLIELIK